MSIIVTASFSNNGVFFAGETVGCTISFTNPLPAPSPLNHGARRGSASTPPHFSLAPSRSTASANRSSSHNRSRSLTAAEAARDGHPPAPRSRSSSTNVRGTEVDAVVITNRGRKTASLTSLASSTFAFFTGTIQDSAKQQQQQRPPLDELEDSGSSNMDDVQELDLGDKLEPDLEPEPEHDSAIDSDQPVGLVTLQKRPFSLDIDRAADGITPRSSLELHSASGVQDSRRNSLESDASTTARFTVRSRRPSSQLSKAGSSPGGMVRRHEILLWSFAQVIGYFVVDGNLINTAEFEPLKTKGTVGRDNGIGESAMGGGTLGIFSANPFAATSSADIQGRPDNKNIPMFSTPPSLLFVDLHLAPGETKTYLYEVTLPTDLPPTHRGKTIRINYNLIIGTQRGAVNHQSHVVQLPFRVFNHVSEDGTRPVYDLMNPVVVYRDEAIVRCLDENDHKARDKAAMTRADFLDYVDSLVESSKQGAVPAMLGMSRRESEGYIDPGSKTRKTCTGNVYALTKQWRKALFDICKVNDRVAQLQLTKSSYRLGETLNGIINFAGCAVSTYQVTVTLESSEVVEPSIATRPAEHITRVSRRVHAEHHESCLNTRRTTFALPIPASGSPEFMTTGVQLQWHLRIEFVTGADESFVVINSDERHRHYQAVQDVEVSSFDCAIPIRMFPGGQDRALFNASKTFMVV